MAGDGGVDAQADGTNQSSTPDAEVPECVPVCDEGTACVAGACCPQRQACGAVCCSGDTVCAFGQCAAPGRACLDSEDCADQEYCDRTIGEEQPSMCDGEEPVVQGYCLPRPPTCAAGEELPSSGPITCLPECEFRPEPGEFNPVVKAQWNKDNIMMTPVVIQLDDDNCDGKVTARDIPEIVFLSFPDEIPRAERGDTPYTYKHGHATLRAVSLVDGELVEKWKYKPTSNPLRGMSSIAAGNFDGQPGNEIVMGTANDKVVAVDADGKHLWTNHEAGTWQISIGDAGGDGTVEVLTETHLLRGSDGRTLQEFPFGVKTFADINGDGKLDIVGASGAWNPDGTVLADPGIEGTYLAIGDFDGDQSPEVVSVDDVTHTITVWRYEAGRPGNARVLRTGVDINGTVDNHCEAGLGVDHGGGPPTIADFNGDSVPDVAIAGGIGYAVVDGTKILDSNVAPDQTLLWHKRTHDCSSAITGSSVFDFNGDGRAEVVYSDEHYFRIYDGPNGNELYKTCNSTGTLIEYPLVADVDGDGHADILLVSNDYVYRCPNPDSAQTGLRILGDVEGKWVRTRRIWNQHNYHVTNIEEDGTVPVTQDKNWLDPRLNNYRQNIQPRGEFAAPDLVVRLSVACAGGMRLRAIVRNVGAASVPAGAVVGLYSGEPGAGGELLDRIETSRELAPAESEVLEWPIDEFADKPYYAVVDDGSPVHAWRECDTDNNTFGPVPAFCPGPR